MRCAAKGCKVESDGTIPFHGEFCQPCYDFITQGLLNHSTAYWNSGIPQLRGIAEYMKTVLPFYLETTHVEELSPTGYYASIRQECPPCPA